MGETFIIRRGGGGGSGFAVTVRHCGANATVTARHGTKQETAIADADGVAVFEKLSKGVWILTTSAFSLQKVVEVIGQTNTSFLDLPSEYTELTYIEGTGTQYINTGYILKANDKVELKTNVTAHPHQFELVFGACKGGFRYNAYNLFCRYNNANTFTYTRTGAEANTGIFCDLGVDYRIVTQGNRITINENITTVGGTINDCINPCAIFTVNEKDGSGFTAATAATSSMRLYYFVITSGETVTFYGVPCSRDGVVGLYDFVSNAFLENVGTGSFIAGGVVDYTHLPNGQIICTAPIGSTITASNGTQTFKADKTLIDDTEMHVISIKPEYFSTSPITVTCVKADGSSDTREAIVNSNKNVNLDFAQAWLFKDGNQYPSRTGGWTTANFKDTVTSFDDEIISDATHTGSGIRYNHVLTVNPIDLTKFNALSARLHLKNRYGASNNCIFGLVAAGNGSDNYVAKWETSNSASEIDDIITVDVSGISGNYYVQFGFLNLYFEANDVLLE